MQMLGHKSRKHHEDSKGCNRNESLLVVWRIDLLPNNEWQPRLEHICHLIHAADDKSTFLVVSRADFVSPCHDDARETTVTSGENITSIPPAEWKIQGDEGAETNDVHDLYIR